MSTACGNPVNRSILPKQAKLTHAGTMGEGWMRTVLFVCIHNSGRSQIRDEIRAKAVDLLKEMQRSKEKDKEGG